LLLLVTGASACSVRSDEGCNPAGPASESACKAGSVLRGTVVKGAREADLFTGKVDCLNVTVKVVEVLKAEAGVEGLRDKVPFDAIIRGFQPCCVCGTEPPGVSDAEFFFFVASQCRLRCTGEGAVFMLSPDSVGTGKVAVSDTSRAHVASGIETDIAGDSCTTLYCKENPTCATRGCTAGAGSAAATLQAPGLLLLPLSMLLLLH